ncbi:hypothetical protein P4U99_01275 [Brevibacillus agri]|uniref:alpha/beta fold hydrolase n=1 Tax=Brevibacillus agri TaxID=51101 RepID=UPI002E23428D|nr:hypothetical protein [Brevibacillus agri]MED1655045.1 hypothetical protein [Brevibacillus agri]MED1687737.1 hypothetical protein [Brevibacillus agri]MED1692922.1 hypothetical protein [Brevibacillus agri]MED1698199.1 hypothetical protein [Brevibacillus agri]
MKRGTGASVVRTSRIPIAGGELEYSVTGRADAPVLLLLADETKLPDEAQRTFCREAAVRYQHAVPQAKVRMIPDSLHLLMVTHPQETVKAIDEFLHS